MPPRRPRLTPIAVGAALALLLTRRRSRPSVGQQPASSSEPSVERAGVAAAPAPRLVRFIQRHALAEIAALIGIPLAVIGVFYNALATRDAALQLESSNRQLEASIAEIRVAEQAAQPELSLNGHLAHSGPANRPERFDRLSLAVTGVAKQVSARIDTVFALQTDDPILEFSVTFFEWWRWAGSSASEAASWTANPRLLRELDSRQQKKYVVLFSLVEVTYADVFGRFHTKYFRVDEWLGRRPPFGPGPTSIIAEIRNVGAAVRCLQQLAVQRNKEQGGSSLVEGVVRRQTRLYAKLTQGKPATLADLSASVSAKAPRDCYPQ
jgi:hypothetical protein